MIGAKGIKHQIIFGVVLGYALGVELFLCLPVLSAVVESLFFAFFVPVLGLKKLVMINAISFSFALIKGLPLILMQFSFLCSFGVWVLLVGVFIGLISGIAAMTASNYLLYFVFKRVLKKWFKMVESLR